ncbi:DNA alkylation repair enzyme [Capnocytophaga ochracea]|uniref:DNA alkylation repair enzyme n=1 Tax=Capnocytophaga ochracea TaxID=1018 RepID=A0A2X2RLP0_CAPOC|nr:DNA alkylation repair protein [Capnocytophaga ochracea]SQA77573.1 DNA alkylation repair enzyme [Capnocytophaga ochracea]
MNIEIIKNRKGAQKAVDIPSEVLSLLNAGSIETVNLTEWLAVDHSQLVKSVFPALGIDKNIIEELVCQINQQKKPSTMNTIKLIGALLYKKYANTNLYEPFFEQLSTHLSDSVRCYACYLVAFTDTPLEDKLYKLKRLVADSHFGVREVIWMALRPEMSEHLDFSIAFLSHWAESEDENIRRFSTEALRPRGVWCAHIEALKEKPELYLPILDKLKSDRAKYVQDSVGNWLNDASKTRPDFVTALCERWESENSNKETKYIVKKALRSIA